MSTQPNTAQHSPKGEHSSHTPGPWTTVSTLVCKRGSDMRRIHLAETWHCFPSDSCRSVESIEEAEANARLIAAAPEMLAALRLCAQFVSNATLNDGIGNTLADGTVECLKRHEAAKLVSAAIARAVGENASGKATPG